MKTLQSDFVLVNSLGIGGQAPISLSYITAPSPRCLRVRTTRFVISGADYVHATVLGN